MSDLAKAETGGTAMAVHPISGADGALPGVNPSAFPRQLPAADTGDSTSSDPDDVGTAERPERELMTVAQQAALVAVGLAAAAVVVVMEAVWRTLGHGHDRRAPDEPPLAALVTGAALGMTLGAGAVAAKVTRVGWTVARWSTWLLPVAGVRDVAGRTAEEWNERWEATLERSRVAATAFAGELVPAVLDATLDQIDLTSIVRDRVDLDAVVASVDIDAVVASVDLDAVVASVDIDRIVERLDVGAIASRIDPDAIVERVDVERIVRRLDLTAIAREVIEELDLLSLIRESSESVTSDAVDDLRLGAVDADRAVARAVDRILRRRSARVLEITSEPAPDTSS
jgi:hypothetical protein